MRAGLADEGRWMDGVGGCCLMGRREEEGEPRAEGCCVLPSRSLFFGERAPLRR